MQKELSKSYEPQSVEQRIYAMWRDGGYFKAERDPAKKPFTIVIPPPNVTGQLHMGHALDETWQDALTRYKRMRGYAALWLPGTDHAGIATQIKVEAHLRETEGKSRFDYGREKFVDIVWDWKERYEKRIIEQLSSLGSSCDWSRLRFTMDEGLSRAVREVFVRMYEKGLIYRGNRIINWCPRCRTALSDAEVEYAEQAGHFWYIKYPVKDSDEYVVIATTRPETMLGDTAVAVHPDDERYTHLVGKTLILPLVGREIPVIADEYVEKDFGTGCVKITPCHDPNDFEVGKRHNLPEVLIMDEDANIINTPRYNGLNRYEARKQIISDLQADGLLIEIEKHDHNVGECHRCGDTVEPITSLQWFVRMQPLAEPAIGIVENGTIKFVPERFTKNYVNWMAATRDWCISRQLWWGHRVPAFYCDACGHMEVSREDITSCPKCDAPVRQDSDVLDTWFSSALWPFSTLGWPDDTEDLRYFFPTDVLVTGYDIIGFWVSRMIFSSVEQMKSEPFHTVVIHGLVRDELGRKMSKSLGNGVEPMEIVGQYGADALRMSLLIGNGPGADMRFTTDKVESMRNFANKLWNAARFVMMNLSVTDDALPNELTPEDKWVLHNYNALVADITDNIEKYELGLAVQKIYDFTWDVYCDWFIELCKPRLQAGGQPAENAQRVLIYVLGGILKLLHPFMPFITEEIWQSLPARKSALIVADWDEYKPELSFPADAAAVDGLMDAVRAVRARRAEMGVPPSKKAALTLIAENPAIYREMEPLFMRLAYASTVEYADAPPADLSGYTAASTATTQIFMPTGDLVDKQKELDRIERELAKALREHESLAARLKNEGFISKAPEAVIASERERCNALASLIEKLQASKSALI